METYTAPTVVSYGDARTLTAAAGGSVQTDQIIVNGRSVDEQTGSLDLCATQNRQNCLGS